MGNAALQIPDSRSFVRALPPVLSYQVPSTVLLQYQTPIAFPTVFQPGLWH